MTDTPAKQRLHVLQAIEDGWNAFAKALAEMLPALDDVAYQHEARIPFIHSEDEMATQLP